MSSDTRLELSVLEDVTLAGHGGNWVTVQHGNFEHTFDGLSKGMVAVFERLSAEGATEEQLTSLIFERDGPNGLIPFHRVLYQLGMLGMLCRTIWAGEAPQATYIPTNRGFAFQPDLAIKGQPYVLSRFAYLHKDGAQIQVESPLGMAKILLHDARVGTLAVALAQPHHAAALAEKAGGLPEWAVLQFLTFMLNNKALLAVEGDEFAEADLGKPLGCWEFHDLLFHARSRLGRHSNPYGGTFHMKGTVPPPPLVKPQMSDRVTPLHKPDLEALSQNDQPFTTVLETRRSVRDYDNDPINLEQLGDFLYRTARVQHRIPTTEDDMDYSLRPYPGGGAIHELEIYPVVGQCMGLEPGIYHYNPLEHHLTEVTGRTKQVDELLYIAWQTADRKSQPNVYFAITARFNRFQWKYQSMAYAAILKNVGVLYQTMYLVATAMELAPCALGGGHSDLFSEAAGLDYYSETTVGEFMLGSKRKR